MRSVALAAALTGAVVALSVPAGAQASAATSSPASQAFPFKYKDCRGLWFKMYAPRDRLQEAVPERYTVYAGNTNDSPLDEPASTVFGNLYIQTDRCTDAAGHEITVSRVSAQVRRPTFDTEDLPAVYDVEKPVGDWWEYYYLLGFVISEPDGGLRDYLAAHGLPAFKGSIDAVLEEMGAQPTGYVTPRVAVDGPDWLDYNITGFASSMLFSDTHEHITPYYHDSVGPNGQTRTSRMVINSLTVDWPATCNTTTTSDRLAHLMGASINPKGPCFVMKGSATGIRASTLPQSD